MTLIFPADPLPHSCQDVLAEAFATVVPRPNIGSVARCTCDRYFVLDERTGRWKRLPRWSRRVREAIAHFEEREQHGGGH